MKAWLNLVVLALAVQAIPTEKSGQVVCTSPTQRKSWHRLTKDEKLSYLNAEKCLMALPGRLSLPPARTRFDELQITHVGQTIEVHGVGAFLPFHRYFMHVHEVALRSECNYTGPITYWDETLDAGNFSKSIILNPDTGFGGDGAGPNSCISNGPFRDYINVIGPGQVNTQHCIERKIDDCFSQGAAKKEVDACMKMKTFEEVWHCLEGAPHGAGHGGIGGQMTNLFSSPGDPIFYLHHGFIDKLWWDWQQQNASARIHEIGGTNQGTPFGGLPSFNGTFPGFNGTFPGFNGTFPGFNGTFPGFNGTTPPFGPNVTIPGIQPNGSCVPFGAFPAFGSPIPGASRGSLSSNGAVDPHFVIKAGDPGNITTMAHILTSYGSIPNATIGDVMDTKGGYLCYEYV